jgi:hypothetical protein
LDFKKGGIDSSLSAAFILPSSGNSTVLTSNLSPSSVPCVNSVADDDPLYSLIGRDSPSILDKGRGDNEIDFDKEDFVVDSYARPIALELNAIDIPRPAFIPSYYVQSATSDDDDDDVPVTAAIPFAVASSKMKEVTSVEGNNPEAPRAQIDTGAFTSFTDQHPVATPAISSAAGVASSDPELADTSQRTTIQAIYAHQEGDYVLDKCPIGIQAKQINGPPGSHMTCFAMAYCQRLSIDFSVSGAINLSDYLTKPLGWVLDAETPLDFQMGRR